MCIVNGYLEWSMLHCYHQGNMAFITVMVFTQLSERQCYLPVQQTSMTCCCRGTGSDEDFIIPLFGSSK